MEAKPAAPSSQMVELELRRMLPPSGFEVYPFKIGWYNEKVDRRQWYNGYQTPFHLDYNDDTLAFLILSTPDMFEKVFKPYICRQDCDHDIRNPIDECMSYHFNLIKQNWPDDQVVVMQDFHVNPMTGLPTILVQTAGHVSGAAFYYQQFDLEEGTWPQEKKMFGVSVHPEYGGWFSFRGVVIFKEIECPDLEEKLPVDCVPTQELRKELLERCNFHWQDWSYRDIVRAVKQYSEEQKTYFKSTLKDRKELIKKMKSVAKRGKRIMMVTIITLIGIMWFYAVH